VFAQGEQQRHGEAAAGTVACYDDVFGLVAGSQQPAIRSFRIVHGCREGMFRGQTIINDQRLEAGLAADTGDHEAVGGRAADDVSAAMEIQQYFSGASVGGRFGGGL